MTFVWYVGGVPEPYLRAPHPTARVEPVSEPAATTWRAAAEAYHEEPLRAPVTRAAQIMTAPVVTLSPDSPRERARDLVRRFRFRHLPIVGDHGRIVGIVSDRDLHGNGIVQDVMTERVLTGEPGTPIREIARILVDERINALPIVDGGRLVGIVTTTDVLRAIVRGAPVELWT